MLPRHVRVIPEETVMRIVPRLARSAAVAALAAAALAIPATSASAETNRQQCLEGRISTANRWMGYAAEFAQQGNWEAYWWMVDKAISAYGSALDC
jgi:hypothetical protein